MQLTNKELAELRARAAISKTETTRPAKKYTPIEVSVIDELRGGYPDDWIKTWARPEERESWRSGYLYAVSAVTSSCAKAAGEARGIDNMTEANDRRSTLNEILDALRACMAQLQCGKHDG